MVTFRTKNIDVIKNCLEYIKGLTGEYEITIKRAKRSNPQNRLYWNYITVIGNELGYTKDEMHEEFASRFIGVEGKTTLSGKLLIRPKSTTDLSTKEFGEYLAMVEAFAMSQDIILPHPSFYGLEQTR